MPSLHLLVAVFPIIIIGLYIYNKDKEKEPISFLMSLLFKGIISGILVIVINVIFYFIGLDFDVFNMNTYELLLYVFLFVGFVEEGSKLLFLYRYAYNSKYYDYTFDMIVYSVFVSLGFAVLENILYVYSYGIEVGLQRSVTAIIFHACCGVIMGLFLGVSKIKELNNDKKSNVYKLSALIIPTIIHGMYDFCAFSNSLPKLIIVLIIILATSILFVNYINDTDRKLIDCKEVNNEKK